MSEWQDIAAELEAAALRKVRGWYGAHPCKPFPEIAEADAMFRVANHLLTALILPAEPADPLDAMHDAALTAMANGLLNREQRKAILAEQLDKRGYEIRRKDQG